MSFKLTITGRFKISASFGGDDPQDGVEEFARYLAARIGPFDGAATAKADDRSPTRRFAIMGGTVERVAAGLSRLICTVCGRPSPPGGSKNGAGVPKQKHDACRWATVHLNALERWLPLIPWEDSEEGRKAYAMMRARLQRLVNEGQPPWCFSARDERGLFAKKKESI